uniref:Uncharacterized protein n=1 Tax=viral metagenome TaxID=1070528 RepID=A0A6C0JYU9_9ZZZZ
MSNFFNFLKPKQSKPPESQKSVDFGISSVDSDPDKLSGSTVKSTLATKGSSYTKVSDDDKDSFKNFGTGAEDYETVAEDYETVASDLTSDDVRESGLSYETVDSAEEVQKRVDAQKAKIAAAQLKKQQQQLQLQKESDEMSKYNKTKYQNIDQLDRVLAFFDPAYNMLSAVPVVGEILSIVGDFVVKFKDNHKLIAIGDLLFKNIDQMFAKIAEMEKLYITSTPVTISISQRGGNIGKTKDTPKEFIELIELLEELYINLLSMVLTNERVNLIAKQLMADDKYNYTNSSCGRAELTFTGLNCTFNDKILAYIDSRQTLKNKIGDTNAKTNVGSAILRGLKLVGKRVYRQAIASEMIDQLLQLNTLVNTAFSIALSQYVLDVKDEHETVIQEIKASAIAAVKKAEEAIQIASIRESISTIQTASMNRTSTEAGVSVGGRRRTMKKRGGEKKQNKQKMGKTHKYLS